MKKLVLLFFLGAMLSICLFCTKRLFRFVRVKGVLIDWYNHQPGSGNVRVFSDSQRRQNREEIALLPVKADGSFDKKFRAAREGHYFFFFNEDDPQHNLLSDGLPIKDNSTHDFGELMLPHRFVCEITLKYNSWRDAKIHFRSNVRDTSFGRYANAVFHLSQSMSQSDFERNNGAYLLTYDIFTPSANEFTTVAIPIIQSDTVKAEVYF